MENIRIQGLVASKERWEEKNPVLLNGETGVEIFVSNEKVYKRTKTGDGVTPWNLLSYNDLNLYPYVENATTTIGGLNSGTNWYNKPIQDIVKQIITPYINPSIKYLRFNNSSSTTLEVGTPFNSGSTHSLSWDLNTEGNVANQNTGTLWSSESGIVDEFGNSLNKGNVNLLQDSPFTISFTNTYKKDTPGTLSFYVQGFNTNGASMSSKVASISWIGKIYWGSSPLNKLETATQVKDLVNKSLGNGNRDYDFNGGGYSYVAIPSFLNISEAVFQDIDLVTGAVISEYAINTQDNWESGALQTITVNNGYIDIPYVILRSQYEYGNGTICRFKFVTTN